MARFLPALLVVALLGGSAAAFAVTERLKLERSPILGTLVDKVVSPTSGRPARIRFRLRKADRISLSIVDSEGKVVRSLLSSRHERPGLQRLKWNGRDDAGVIVADGTYRPRVHLTGDHRTILLPNPIRVDTQAPTIDERGLNLRVFSPDGDYRHDYLRVSYRASEPVRPVLYSNGRILVKWKFFRASGSFDWSGRADGLPRPAGVYHLRLRGIDRANNLGDPSRVFTVQIRYIELARHRIRAHAGGRIAVRVFTDARSYRWRLGRRRGRVRSGRLVLTAGAAGRYSLVVTQRGHSDRALVLVTP